MAAEFVSTIALRTPGPHASHMNAHGTQCFDINGASSTSDDSWCRDLQKGVCQKVGSSKSSAKKVDTLKPDQPDGDYGPVLVLVPADDSAT